MKQILKKIPSYVWTLLALITGMLLGSFFPKSLAPVGKGTQVFLDVFIQVVPILIFFALSPAIASLAKRGKGSKLAGSLIVWYLLTSTVAGLIGLTISSILFDISFSSVEGGMAKSAWSMFKTLNGNAGASWPLLAILFSVLAGLISLRIPPLYRFFEKVQKAISNSSKVLGIIMPILVFFLGITLGINTGAQKGMSYYLLMTLYTAGLCLIWWFLYVFVVLGLIGKQSIKKVLTEYYFPTAIFAASTCSSLATLPVNLDNAKKYGVKKHIADFIIPVGAIVNMDTSAMAYVAYAPFIMTVVFDMQLDWSVLLVAWPAVVLFTIAAPGLPAGMGTALWSSTLFAALMGLTGDMKTEFITTWIALSGGIPDMLRTATNCTGDGFTAIFFNNYFK